MNHKLVVSRREWLKRVGAAASVSAADTAPTRLTRPASTHSRRPGVRPQRSQARRNADRREAETLGAIAARLIPTDSSGPGATEARAAQYIDRALGGALASFREDISIRARRRRSLRAEHEGHIRSRVCRPPTRTRLLRDVERNAATGFSTTRPRSSTWSSVHTIQGTFCDPLLRRQRELRRLGSDRLPGRPSRRDRRRAGPQRTAVAHPHVRVRLPDVLRKDVRRVRRSIRRTRKRPSWRLSSRRPTSSSSDWAPSAAWRRCRWCRPVSTSSVSRPGSWLRCRRLRARRAAQQLSRLAAVGAEGQPRDPDASAQRVGALLAASDDSSDDERGRRHHAPLLGAELAAQPVGLQGGERDDAALRRIAHPERIDRRGLAVRARGAGAVLRSRRARDRRIGQGGQHQRQDRSRRQHLRGSRAHASTRCHRFADPASPT